MYHHIQRPFTYLCANIPLPPLSGKITLRDLKSSQMMAVFFNTFMNIEKYLDYEQRDPVSTAKEEEELQGAVSSDWDKFASEQYETLLQEEQYDQDNEWVQDLIHQNNNTNNKHNNSNRHDDNKHYIIVIWCFRFEETEGSDLEEDEKEMLDLLKWQLTFVFHGTLYILGHSHSPIYCGFVILCINLILCKGSLVNQML